MRKILIVMVANLIVLAGALSLFAVAQPRDMTLDLGPLPITAPQLRERLAAAGFSNIYVTPRTRLEVLAVKNGVNVKLAVDAQSGTVTRMWEDNDDDD